MLLGEEGLFVIHQMATADGLEGLESLAGGEFFRAFGDVGCAEGGVSEDEKVEASAGVARGEAGVVGGAFIAESLAARDGRVDGEAGFVVEDRAERAGGLRRLDGAVKF
jgi:hypothetical protein